jgi:hypothetical protein
VDREPLPCAQCGAAPHVIPSLQVADGDLELSRDRGEGVPATNLVIDLAVRRGGALTAVADRGRAFKIAISPKNSPAGSTASTRSVSPTLRRISISPCVITYM